MYPIGNRKFHVWLILHFWCVVHIWACCCMVSICDRQNSKTVPKIRTWTVLPSLPPSLSRANKWEDIFTSWSERNLIGFEQIRWESNLWEPDLTGHTLWKNMKFWRNAPLWPVRCSKSQRCLSSTLLLRAPVFPASPDYPEALRKPIMGFRQHNSAQEFHLCASANICVSQIHTLKPEFHCCSSTRWSLGNDSRTVSSAINGVSAHTKETPRVAWPSTTVERRHCLWTKIQPNKQQEKDVTKKDQLSTSSWT